MLMAVSVLLSGIWFPFAANDWDRALGVPQSKTPPPSIAADSRPKDGETVANSATAIALSFDRRFARSLVNRSTGAEWLAAPSPLYEIDAAGKIEAKLTALPLPNGEIQLDLELKNPSAAAVKAKVAFPVLRGLGPGGNTSELGYCFPSNGAAIATAEIRLERAYSGSFPLQFMDVHHPAAGGVYLMTRDTAGEPKTFWLKKRKTVDFGVGHPARSLAAGEVWKLPSAVVAAHRGDWHDALAAYRRWLSTWHRPAAPRKKWFCEVFNFRQMFLHPIFNAPGAFDPAAKKYRFSPMLEEDAKAFGGIDYVHVFDWSADPQRGRVGDYQPWDHLGGVEPFRREIRQMQGAGIRAGLYLEGYLLSPESKTAQARGRSWQMLDAAGKPYTRMGDFIYPCPLDPAWREHLADSCARAVKETGADGIYLDELGFGWQYPCFNPNHGHATPSNQNRAEAALLRRVRAALPAETALYTEETGTDVNTQYLDGSFTYAVASSRNELNPARVNLLRFALPDFKLFEIIRCDAPLGDDREAVRHVFFNGEGIWLEGPSADPKWFPPATCELIRKTHRILRANREAFCALEPEPLVPTLRKEIYANRFPAGDRTVWTLFNASSQRVKGALLEVAHRPGATYRDLWNDHGLPASIAGGKAVLSLDIGPREVGCVVQNRK